MRFELALILTEYALLFSIFLQSIENMQIKKEKLNLAIQITKIITIILVLFYPQYELWLFLILLQVLSLREFRGNLNGGSDAMTTITLLCVAMMNSNHDLLRKFGFYYLSVQVILSYFVAGIVKLKESDWRNGEAFGKFLQRAFYRNEFSARFLQNKFLFKPLSIFTLVWEISFPLLYFYGFPQLTLVYLAIGALFHLLNAVVFGLHRFFWTWIATYPILFCFLS